MYYELRRHKRNDTIKWIAIFLIAILLATAVAAIFTQGFKVADPYCWFSHDYDEDGVCVRCGAEKPVEDEADEADKGLETAFVQIAHIGV